jgi:hypothetical protein
MHTATVARYCRQSHFLRFAVPVLYGVCAGRTYAQQVPSISAPVISAAEAAYHVTVQQKKNRDGVSFRQAYYPLDSMNAVVASTGIRWLTRLQGQPVQGIQHDPAATVSVAAQADAYARSQISARLATSRLAFEDKAFTYLTAVQAFADAMSPGRLVVAEEYLVALDAMGDSAAVWRFKARQALVDAYARLGQSVNVIRHGVRAFQLMPLMQFYDRGQLLPSWCACDFYPTVIDALSGQPGGKNRIDSLNALAKAVLIPSPSLVARDPEFAKHGREYQEQLNTLIAATSKIGSQGAPLVSNYWLNRPTRDSAQIPVNDGKIRVLEVATYGCPACVIALHGMQRLQNALPDIEVFMLSWTLGSWANRLVDADEEVARLTEYFLNHEKITIPIAIWKATKVPNQDGGMTPENYGPNIEHYPLAGKPMIWVLDGRGMIRRVFTGYSRDTERQILRTVQFLRREITP